MDHAFVELMQAADVVEVVVRCYCDHTPPRKQIACVCDQADDSETSVHEQIRIAATDVPTVTPQEPINIRFRHLRDAVTDVAPDEPFARRNKREGASLGSRLWHMPRVTTLGTEGSGRTERQLWCTPLADQPTFGASSGVSTSDTDLPISSPRRSGLKSDGRR